MFTKTLRTLQSQVLNGWHLSSLHGFKNPEIFNSLHLYDHNNGSQLLHVHSDDPNVAFCVFFRTPPSDNTGIFHILEHSTLEGPSAHFATKNIFFEMTSRSLNTFMNAWTGFDWTAYLFSTTDAQHDLFNLIDIYLDCTFYPVLNERILQQEGHRIEFNEDNDQYEIQGVAYNEMKGVFSEPSTFVFREIQRHLFPGTAYEFESGGEPCDITNLDIEMLQTGHQNWYDFKNAKFVVYGDCEIQKVLEFVEFKMSLHDENSISVPENESFQEKNVPTEHDCSLPVRKREFLIPPDQFSLDENKRSKFVRAYLLKNLTDDEIMIFSLISSLLFDNPRGFLYQNIIDVKKGVDFFSEGFMNVSYGPNERLGVFIVGLQYLSEDECSEFGATEIDFLLQKFGASEIDEEFLRSLLHVVEIEYKKPSSSMGIEMIVDVLYKWKTEDFVKSLDTTRKFNEFVEQGVFSSARIMEVFSHRIRENTKFLQLEMQPNDQFFENQREEELRLIEQLVFEKGDENIQGSSEENNEKLYNPDVLPKLLVSDLSKSIPYSLDSKVTKQDNIWYNESTKTNGLVFVTLKKQLRCLENIDLGYLSLLEYFLNKIGTKNFTNTELSTQIDLCTDGIKVNLSVLPDLETVNNFEVSFLISSCCLEKNVDKMVSLLNEIIGNVRFVHEDNFSFIENEIKKIIGDVNSSIVDNGHLFAASLSESYMYPRNRFSFETSGLGLLKKLNVEIVSKTPKEIANELQLLHKRVFIDDSNPMEVLITSDTNNSVSQFEIFRHETHVEPQKSDFGMKVSGKSSAGVFFPIDSMVNFLSRSIRIDVCYSDHERYCELLTLSKYLESKYFLPQIRFVGGAYGARCSFSHGVMTAMTYRDPNFDETIRCFDSMAEWFENTTMTSDDLNEAKLEVFQSLDYPSTEHQLAKRAFLYGITDDVVQRRRDVMFDISVEDIEGCFEKYLKNNSSHCTAALGECLTELSQDFTKFEQ